ncbi:MAG: cell division protein FtsQ [Novosphingobium sp. 17-62-19]|uniref:cell division protein FtsQ/DivIB n=1 Tax=Novosphingobium sp. 17-62-19 TaxID=1970406 RepID=UPI000BC63B82|nr:FtsQ-type POTRA domain-containing protein [Novosphingobium sp. 17-62-19]OYX96751.1 MAG: cell division protein FtsQ [Novosphingobium sp. 35-62-5]OZA20669.1 MAG: cell division protein FtsQ [Novosphingobium sp. 17-62-19]HQS96621.1 FtsQ-type POTRA domain-containing protein [Novosphingobium sp.]
MAQTIKRGGKGVRRAAAARTTQRKVQTARKQTGSLLDSVMVWMPFSEETLHRIVMLLILGVTVAIVWTVAVLAGVPALASEQAALIASDAGFKVSHLEVRGVNRMNEQKIYEKILGQNDRAMTTLNLAALRDELNAISWVKDARVSRKLPDTLVIDIVERSPHAVLRKPDRLVLIDDTGAELETVKPDRAKGMLVLTGLGVGKRVQDLTHLLDAAPALKPQVAEAEWVGNRRWNLTFKTGQILVLPEGDEKSAGALLSFARMDGVNRLLGGKVAAFDMRAGDRIYMRVPGHAEEQAEEKRAAAQAKAEAKRIAAAARADEG